MHLYAIAIGSNRTCGVGRRPADLVWAAMGRLGEIGRVTATAPLIETAPIGPSDRRFMNSACLLVTPLDPPRLLASLQAIEHAMGRRRAQRWGARTIDIDILLWSGGGWEGRRPDLTIPHPALPARAFVLQPLVTIASDWRLPDGRRIRHLAARLTRRAPFHRATRVRVRSSVGRASDF